MILEERLAALHLLGTPVWVYDVTVYRILWANRAAVALWQAGSVEALLQRDFSPLTDLERTRQSVNQESIERGQVLIQDLSIFPSGDPVRLRCILSGVPLDDGRIAMMCEAHVKHGVDLVQLRGIEAIRHTSALVTLATPLGEVLMQNPASQRAYGVSATIEGWFTDPAVLRRILERAADEAIYRGEVQIATTEGARWHLTESRPTRDPATGAPAILIQQVDVHGLHESRALIDAQREEILALSAPMLDVGQRSLVMPIIGALDRARSAQISESLLARIVDQQVESVILDFTGASAICVPELLSLLRALSLLGARPILCGVRPSLAQELVAGDAPLGDVLILRDLRQAIAACVRAGPRGRRPSPPARATTGG
ncbi:STAS domain-containing protein [Chondromyces apiculatus]|uniref:RsbR, positive regulator of sigma-B n=1 Tax=Chondromyces apiculatus DSM 436 TaxID=1192034 RepID=A0A017T3Z5_9BACT|nr:STAS domain-containing protein [Chondromyces apiculatus]EYF03291.1 RsbR, positive regulator of sigma-B [Chondromyces apiculatus DSM 436]